MVELSLLSKTILSSSSISMATLALRTLLVLVNSAKLGENLCIRDPLKQSLLPNVFLEIALDYRQKFLNRIELVRIGEI